MRLALALRGALTGALTGALILTAMAGGASAQAADPVPASGAVSADAAAALEAANALLATLGNPSKDAFLSHVKADGSATAVVEKADGGVAVTRMSWAQFADALPADGRRYEERLIDPMVRTDGDIAMIWSRFVFLVDGETVHCGTNHFDLIRQAGQWKIFNVTWTQRTEGCSRD